MRTVKLPVAQKSQWGRGDSPCIAAQRSGTSQEGEFFLLYTMADIQSSSCMQGGTSFRLNFPQSAFRIPRHLNYDRKIWVSEKRQEKEKEEKEEVKKKEEIVEILLFSPPCCCPEFPRPSRAFRRFLFS